MRTAIMLCACLLSACSVRADISAPERVRAFYASYLPTLASSDRQYPQTEMRDYVSADTITRIEQIDSIPEQDLIESDYFAYAQDYDESWVQALDIGQAKPFMGGEVLPTWVGIQDGKKLELEVFVRREDGAWKIYRVRDVTNNFEHPIFSAGAIARAKAAAESGL